MYKASFLRGVHVRFFGLRVEVFFAAKASEVRGLHARFSRWFRVEGVGS